MTTVKDAVVCSACRRRRPNNNQGRRRRAALEGRRCNNETTKSATTQQFLLALLLLISDHCRYQATTSFCGASWSAASSTCTDRQPCLSGTDEECTSGGTCWADTTCDTSLGRGQSIGSSDSRSVAIVENGGNLYAANEAAADVTAA